MALTVDPTPELATLAVGVCRLIPYDYENTEEYSLSDSNGRVFYDCVYRGLFEI